MLGQKLLITGASGFIGGHLLTRLLNEKCEILALKRPSTICNVCNENIKWIDWSYLNNNEYILDGVSSIIHLATDYGRYATTLVDQYNCNVIYPVYLLELMNKYNIRKFISTDSFFGKYENQYSYMKSYIMMKRHFLEVSKSFSELNTNVSIINMRLEHVYGENDRNNKFVQFVVNEMLAKKNAIKCTSGKQKRDFIYIDDVVSAYMAVLRHNGFLGFEDIEVGTGLAIELRKMVDEIKMNIGSDIRVEYGAVPMRHDEIMESVANTKRLKELCWNANYTLNEGVAKMLAHYKK